MAKPGPKPKRKRRTSKSKISMPSWLPKQARTYWRSIMLRRSPEWTATHAELIAMYCVAISDVIEAETVIETEGQYYTTPNGAIAMHPAVKIRQRALSQVSSIATKLGLQCERPAAEAPKTKDKQLADGFIKFA